MKHSLYRHSFDYPRALGRLYDFKVCILCSSKSQHVTIGRMRDDGPSAATLRRVGVPPLRSFSQVFYLFQIVYEYATSA